MKCPICHKTFEEKELIHGYEVRPEVARLIKDDYPKWNDESCICKDDLRQYRVRTL